MNWLNNFLKSTIESEIVFHTISSTVFDVEKRAKKHMSKSDMDIRMWVYGKFKFFHHNTVLWHLFYHAKLSHLSFQNWISYVDNQVPSSNLLRCTYFKAHIQMCFPLNKNPALVQAATGKEGQIWSLSSVKSLTQMMLWFERRLSFRPTWYIYAQMRVASQG